MRSNINSCRYDSFLTVFALCLYPKLDDFLKNRADKRYKYHQQYIDLCNTSELLVRAKTADDRQQLIRVFWENMFKAKIDENKPGDMGYVQQLLVLFGPLLSLQPFIVRSQVCQFCNFKENKRIRWPLPMAIHGFEDLNYDSIQKYYNWFLNSKRTEQCDICLQQTNQICYQNNTNEPSLIVIELLSRTTEGMWAFKNFTINQEIENEVTKVRYRLIATINHPSANHFNCCLFESNLSDNQQNIGSWFKHDGLMYQGKITLMKNIE